MILRSLGDLGVLGGNKLTMTRNFETCASGSCSGRPWLLSIGATASCPAAPPCPRRAPRRGTKKNSGIAAGHGSGPNLLKKKPRLSSDSDANGMNYGAHNMLGKCPGHVTLVPGSQPGLRPSGPALTSVSDARLPLGKEWIRSLAQKRPPRAAEQES